MARDPQARQDARPYEVGGGFYLGDKVEAAAVFSDLEPFVGYIDSAFDNGGEPWVVVRRPFESCPAPVSSLTRIE